MIKNFNKNPQEFHELLDRLSQACIFFSDIMMDAGVDGILVENGESTADLFSPQMAETFMLPYTKKLYDHIKKRGRYVISHNCAIRAYHDLEIKLSPHAINFAFGDVGVIGAKYGMECSKQHHHNNIGCNPRYCFRELNSFKEEGICLMGNIVPDTLLNGSKTAIQNEVKNCIKVAPRKGFILSTGCEIPLNAPFENMITLRNAIE